MENEDLIPVNQPRIEKETELKENADYRGIAGKGSLNATHVQASSQDEDPEQTPEKDKLK